MYVEFVGKLLDLLDLGQLHPVVPEPVLPLLADVRNLPHGLDGLHVDLPIVLQWLVPYLLHPQNTVLRDLLIMHFTVGLRPGELPRVVLCLEVSVALGPAEVEVFAVVSDEQRPVARVDRS